MRPYSDHIRIEPYDYVRHSLLEQPLAPDTSDMAVYRTAVAARLRNVWRLVLGGVMWVESRIRATGFIYGGPQCVSVSDLWRVVEQAHRNCSKHKSRAEPYLDQYRVFSLSLSLS